MPLHQEVPAVPKPNGCAEIHAATGPEGPAGTAATVTVGTTTTGPAGSAASVTNSGTSDAAVLDFVIPVGATGPEGPAGATGAEGPQGPAGPTGPAADETVPELMSTTNTSPQTPGASTELNLGTKSTDLGTAIDYTDSSTDVSLTENGVYMVSFHSDTKSNSGAVTAQATLQLDSTPVEGGTAQHYFADTTGEANISFTVPVTVSSAPETLTVVSDNADATFTNATLTVWKIGVTA